MDSVLTENPINVETKDIFDGHINIGSGIGGKVSAFGVGAEVDAKRYYNVTTATNEGIQESLEFSAMVKAINKIQVGISASGTRDVSNGEVLGNQMFFGAKVGNVVLGWSNIPYDSDITVDFSIGGYVVIGAETGITINVSELYRRATNFIRNR